MPGATTKIARLYHAVAQLTSRGDLLAVSCAWILWRHWGLHAGGAACLLWHALGRAAQPTSWVKQPGQVLGRWGLAF